MGTYSYSLRGTTEGGATMVTASRSVTITRSCSVSENIETSEKFKEQDIPISGMNTYVVYTAS
jgi:hypothetical protein